MPTLTWLFNRLRLMSYTEVVWRSRKAAGIHIEKIRSRLMPPPLPAITETERWGKPWLAAAVSQTEVHAARYCEAAERILSGSYDVFSCKDLSLGFPPSWNRDPKTGVDAPLVFGKTLDYRDARIVGDIKYLWEINRHYELVTLAQAWHLSGDPRYSAACRQMLDSWFDACPYPLGANWTSSLEHAVRLVNWSVAWQLLGGPTGPLFDGTDGRAFRSRWLGMIYRHCHFISHHLSHYSSANNHLLGEYMGMFIASVTWPCWSESRAWRDTAFKGLIEQACQQNAEDGVNLEQALWYHHEVADMLLLCGLCGRHNETEFPQPYWQRLEAMLTYVAATMDVAGNVPMIGDADDAVMVRFSVNPDFNVYRSLLATGAVLFKRADFKKKAGDFDEKSCWLLGIAGATQYAMLPITPCPPDRQRFPQGGYYVLGSDFNTEQEVRIVADAGPLGYLSIAAHGHADALAFTLFAGGQELLIDPGTFSYHTQPAWRSYFRSTAAHNTVTVDGVDQSETAGNFMWLRKAQAGCELWETGSEADVFAGWHDGYRRLSDPVLHKRKLVYQKRERVLLVEDLLECSGRHEVAFWWHFSEKCEVRIDGGRVRVRCEHVELTMERHDAQGEPCLVSGRAHPPAGWISRRFDERQPSPSVVWREKIVGTTRRVTILRLHLSEQAISGAWL